MTRDSLYRHPSLYDLEYADKAEDVVWYARLASRTTGPILELGCGTGRITIPMARTGATVTGVDLNPPMLRLLERHLQDEPEGVRRRVRVLEQDFRYLSEPAVYELAVFPFNSIHHCANHRDVLSVLRGVRAALRPGGRFALDCYLPDHDLYRRDPNTRYEPRDFIDPRTGGRLRSWEMGEWDPLEQVHHVRYFYQQDDGETLEIHLPLRMYYPQELRALLDLGGFRVISEYEDFDGAPLNPHSLKWVLILEPC